MSSTQVPPWICDRWAAAPFEQRLAARYTQCLHAEESTEREKRMIRRSRDALLTRIRAHGPVYALRWFSDAVLDPPEILRWVTVGRLLDELVGDSRGLADLETRKLIDLDEFQRRYLIRSLRQRATRKEKQSA